MEDKILEAFSAKGAMKMAELATEVGADKKEVEKVVKALVKEEKVYSPKRCFYDAVKAE